MGIVSRYWKIHVARDYLRLFWCGCPYFGCQCQAGSLAFRGGPGGYAETSLGSCVRGDEGCLTRRGARVYAGYYGSGCYGVHREETKVRGLPCPIVVRLYRRARGRRSQGDEKTAQAGCASGLGVAVRCARACCDGPKRRTFDLARAMEATPALRVGVGL